MKNQRMGMLDSSPAVATYVRRNVMIRTRSVSEGRRFAVAIAVCICLNLFGPEPLQTKAHAQRGRQRTTVIQSEVALMAPSREVQVLLEEAESGIKNQQWSEATFALGILLGLEEARKDDFSGVDFFIDKEEHTELVPRAIDTPELVTVNKTIFKRVYELIESLPVDATKMVDLRYGLQATQMLEQAVAAADWIKIAEVSSKYGFTSAGQDATVILAEQSLRRGDLRGASRLLGRVVHQRSALERLGPELGILAAASSHIVGEKGEALGLMEAARKVFGKFDMVWSGTKIGWDSRSLFDQSFFENMGVTGPKAIRKVITEPRFPSGVANRNADTNGGIPLPILYWHQELHESKQHIENLELTMKSKLAEGKSTFIPSRTPISVGPWIIALTYDQRIIAVDAITGVQGWACSYSGMPLGFSMDGFLSRDSHSFNLPAPDYLTKRVWGESMLGTISSDGERLYNISELPAIDVSESFALGQNARVTKLQSFRNYNVMQCWSVREEGKIKWEVGGQKSLTEPKLAGMLFLGSPLPHEKELLVLGELNGDLYLMALAPETGKLIWRQPITTNYATIAGDLMRRSSGAMPAAEGSVIVCPTLSGYLVAYDKSDRSLLWAFKYPVKSNLLNANQVGVFGQLERADFSPLTPRSADNSVVISDNTVIFAPSDGGDAYGLDLMDGSLLWKLSDIKVDQARYVAGAWKDTAIVICQSGIAAVHLRTGEPKWPAIVLPDSQQVVGRGVRKEGVYLLPTSAQKILQVDLSSGKITDAIRTEQPLGNLISVGDRLICASPFELDCYSVREAFQIQLKEELQRNSLSPSGLAKQGELALANGDIEAALNFLEQAYKIDPKNADIVLKLNKVGIAALTADFDKFEKRVDLFENLTIDRDKIPFLRLMIMGLQKQGRYKETLLTLFKLSKLRTSQRQEQMSGSANMVINPTWSIQEDRWIASQVRIATSKLTAKELEECKSVIETEVNALQKLPSHIRRVKLGHFEGFLEAESIRLQSANLLLRQKDYLQAERLLTSDGLLESLAPNSAVSVSRKEILGSIYAKTKRLELAARYLGGDIERAEALAREASASTITGLPLPADTLPVGRMNTKPIEQWPNGKIQVNARTIDIQSLDRSVATDTNACKWKTRIGDSLAGWQVHSASSNLVFSNPSSGERFQIYADIGIQDKSTIPIIHSVDSIVLLEMNGQIIAIDTLRGATREMEGVLWREAFATGNTNGRPQIQTDAKVWGLATQKSDFRVAAVSRYGIICLSDEELSCYDLSSGAKMWTRLGFKGCSFAAYEGKLNVFDPNKRVRLSLNMQDGATIEESREVPDGLSVIASIGPYWLMDSSNKKDSKSSQLHLVDSRDGEPIFKTEMPANSRIAIDGETGVIILKPSRELCYWNLSEKKEFVRTIDGDLKFSQIAVQRFGDTMLLMTSAKAWLLDDFKFGPDDGDANFIPVAGRMLALSAKDASDVWEKSPLVRQFYFPVSQSHQSPIAIFVRMIRMNKVQNRAADFMSIAAIDIRNGKLVYSNDDFNAIRGMGFNQELYASDNRMIVEYLGNRLEMKWTDEQPSDPPVYDFGNLVFAEFKKLIESKGKDLKKPTPSASKPDSSPEK